MTQATDDVVRRNIKRELPCKLTDEEFTRIARVRANKEAERDELEADLAKEKKRRGEQIEELDDEISKMGNELRTGLQDRTVPCNEVFRRADDGTGWIHTIRLDTLGEVERRPATAHETQRYLPGTDPATPGGSVLDDARAQQRAAEQSNAAPSGGDDIPGDDVPGDEPGDDEGGDDEGEGEGEGDGDENEGGDAPRDKPKKAKPPKFDLALLASGKCALLFPGSSEGCEHDVGHAEGHKSKTHSWKARRPKPPEMKAPEAAP